MLDPKLIPSPLLDSSTIREVRIGEVHASAAFRSPRRIWLLLATVFALLWLKLRGRLTAGEKAIRIRLLIETFGGLWVKAGQLMALRRDLFGAEFCAELAKLQDSAVGFSPAIAYRILEDELGCPPDEVFSEFDHKPIAAASIGQVHRARLCREGVAVAVKIQRPDIRHRFDRDMRWIRRVAGWCSRFDILPFFRWDELVLELGQILVEEVDYRMEASSISRMRKSLRKHKIYAPKVFSRYSTARILVMEFVEGVFISDYIHAYYHDPDRLEQWLRENEINPRRVGRRLYFSLNRQVFEDGLFHSDLHPGNILLLRRSRLALIDFGAVGSLEATLRRKYGMMCHAIGAGDYSKAADLLMQTVPAMPSYVDIPLLRSRIIFFFRAWERRALTRTVPYLEKSFSSIFTGLSDIFGKYQVPAGWEFLRLNRTFAALDSPLMHLLPRASFPKLLRQYWVKADGRAIRKSASRKSRIQVLRNVASTLVELPKMLSELMTFEGESLRRNATTLEQTVTKGQFFVAVLFRMLVNAIRIVGIGMLAAFLYQRSPSWFTSGPARDSVPLLRMVPPLGNISWIVAAVLTLYVYHEALLLRNRFATREVRTRNSGSG